MKKSVAAILISGAIVISSVISSCAAPGGQPAVIKAPSPEAEQRPPSAIVVTATAAERLDGIQQSTQMLINQYLMSGQVVPDYMNDLTLSLEKAKRDLVEFDGQRWALQMLGVQHAAAGEPTPDSEYELVQSIEQSRQQVLKSVGLAD